MLAIIGSDKGLSPDRRQAIIRTNAGLLLNGPLGTNCSDILIEIRAFSFKKMRLKISSGKWRPFCLGLNVLTNMNLKTNFRCDPGSWNIWLRCHSVPTWKSWKRLLRRILNDFMMTSSNGNIFRVTVLLCGEFTGHR